MSWFDYQQSKAIIADDPSFCALLMAAMTKADSTNLERLRQAFPEVYGEITRRHDAPGGRLPGEGSPA